MSIEFVATGPESESMHLDGAGMRSLAIGCLAFVAFALMSSRAVAHAKTLVTAVWDRFPRGAAR